VVAQAGLTKQSSERLVEEVSRFKE
jgi:hypothetical protein